MVDKKQRTFRKPRIKTKNTIINKVDLKSKHNFMKYDEMVKFFKDEKQKYNFIDGIISKDHNVGSSQEFSMKYAV